MRERERKRETCDSFNWFWSIDLPKVSWINASLFLPYFLIRVQSYERPDGTQFKKRFKSLAICFLNIYRLSIYWHISTIKTLFIYANKPYIITFYARTDVAFEHVLYGTHKVQNDRKQIPSWIVSTLFRSYLYRIT